MKHGKVILIILIIGLFVSTSFAAVLGTKYKRAVEQHRVELELARARAEQYERVFVEATETNRKLGECVSRSTTTLSGLREQIQEIRRRYEEMENIFTSSRRNDGSSRSDNGSVDSGFD